VELWFLGSNFILNLQKAILLEDKAAVRGLEHTETLACLAYTLATLAHAKPGLELDCCLFLDGIVPQQDLP
jgi:hypothetical protein